MLFSDSYNSISALAKAQLREKGSKFLGYAFPVENEKEIKLCLNQIKKQEPAASHYCYAWRLGTEKLSYKVNDDGEPSGSAGKPIYSQISSRELTNILVVVVRYFGGTLLGVNGLINAYQNTADAALEKAVIIKKYIYNYYRIYFDFEDMNSVMKLLKNLKAEISLNTFEKRNYVEFRIKKEKTSNLALEIEPLYKTELVLLKTE